MSLFVLRPSLSIVCLPAVPQKERSELGKCLDKEAAVRRVSMCGELSAAASEGVNMPFANCINMLELRHQRKIWQKGGREV